ncbi:glycosyltransferase [Microbacterium sp. NPDC096154]|uniref:glycosyltransferase family 4 protein n=1 Tax=Microbacterium sp. NPDC096154 TaxID=3155549 RepID=UPI0033277233
MLVAMHPPYWAMSQFGTAQMQPQRENFAFIGSLRPDKGAPRLVSIARKASAPFRIRFLGTGPLPEALASDLQRAGALIINNPADYTPNDAELTAALRQTRALLAPYSAMTTSGTILLARSLGIEVVTFASPGLPEDPGVFAVANDEEFADTIVGLLRNSSPPRSADVNEWMRIASNAWLQALRRIRER